MPTYKTRISGGDVSLPGHGLSRLDVLIDEGVIQALVRLGTEADAHETIDEPEHYVLPGIIDTHA